MPEPHPGVAKKATTGTRTSKAKPDNDSALAIDTTATTNARKGTTTKETPMTTNTLTAVEIAEQAWRELNDRHAAAVRETEQATATLAALNAAVDDGDDTVTLDHLDHAERARDIAQRRAVALARKAADAEKAYRRAAADTRMADRLAAALRELPRRVSPSPGRFVDFGQSVYTSVAVAVLPDQHPTDIEDRTIYVTQEIPTKVCARTGVESGTVVLALPAETHIDGTLNDRWVNGARRAGMLIGERERAGRRLRKGAPERVTLADGSYYDLYRVTVESAMPDVPLITETDLTADAEYWIGRLVEKVEGAASRTLRYGSPFQLVRDARCAVRDVSASEDVDGDRATRTVKAAGQVSISPMDKFDDLERSIIAPVVDDLMGATAFGDSIAPGLGRPVDIEVTVKPMGRGIADLSITATFASRKA